MKPISSYNVILKVGHCHHKSEEECPCNDACFGLY